MSGSEKTPGFFQRVFGLGGGEAPKQEPPAQQPAKKEPPQSKPARTEPPERQSPPKKAQGPTQAAPKLKAPPPEGPAADRKASAVPDAEPQGPEGDERPKAPDAALKPRTALGWLARLGQGLARSSTALSDNLTSVLSRRKLDEETLDELEEALIKADLGVAMASRIRAALAATRHDRGISPGAVREVLAGEIAKVLEPVAKPFTLNPSAHPHVILVVGVNGTGKTTTIAKLAHHFIGRWAQGHAGRRDTFRAAAIDQLKVWGEARRRPKWWPRTSAPTPRALAYEALERARAEKARRAAHRHGGPPAQQGQPDGRARQDRARDQEARSERRRIACLLVLDATTGQNAQPGRDLPGDVAGRRAWS